MHVRATAPGRVNLIGDHTDYLGGLALPMAIDLNTTVTGERHGDRIRLTSAEVAAPVDLPLDDPLAVATPGTWGRYVAGVVAEVRPEQGFVGTVSSTVPVGSGLSSSAALEVAVALAIGCEGTPHELARVCQRAEQIASGVPCGIMDQLASAAGVEGHALLMDFADLSTIEAVPVPDAVEIVVIHSGQPRALAGSAYAERRAQCEAALEILGKPFRSVALTNVDAIEDGTLRRRARHVVTENQRVRDFVAELDAGRFDLAGDLMVASHRSLRDDFEVSTDVLDALVDRLVALPGVYGARLTGAGFGGCVVALTEPDALDEGWRVRPSAGATVEVTGGTI